MPRLLCAAVVCLASGWSATAAPEAPATTVGGFAIPQPGRAFQFPRDHGDHPEFKIEWWYVTGHLFATDPAEKGRRFGFQATFFRNAGLAPGRPAPQGTEPPAFAKAPLFLAHMAVLDAATGRFLHQERLNRAGWDADSSGTTLDVRNGNWSLRFTGPQPATALDSRPVLDLRGSVNGEAAFQLQLTPAKPLVIFGKDGVSRKAADPAAASHYLTWPRLDATGTLRMDERSFAVTGLAWMDHEISSSQLSSEQTGWDWAAIQLKDGREIMAYRMRLKDGSTDPFSTLAWIDKSGTVTHQTPAQFSWKSDSTWTSPVTRAPYPAGATLTTVDPATGQPLTLRLTPLAPAQEITGGLGGIPYWEGACRVTGASGQDLGSAFLELTGYTGDLAARFR